LPVSRGWIFWDKKPNVPNYSDGELAWTSFDKILKRKEIMWNGKIRTGIEKGYVCIHPTQKPVKLYKWLLSNYAKPGDKILDTHLGSGSSRIAAYDMGFDFVGFELDKEYFDASCKRFDLFKQQLKLF
jgi:site-specific DNA-methyltransferase (adenine-specific)